MASELRTCPFCGEQPILEHRSTGWQVYCGNCFQSNGDGCGIEPCSNTLDEEEQIVSAWNTRPVEDALVEALKKCDDHLAGINPDELSMAEKHIRRIINAALKQAGRE